MEINTDQHIKNVNYWKEQYNQIWKDYEKCLAELKEQTFIAETWKKEHDRLFEKNKALAAKVTELEHQLSEARSRW